MTSKILINAVDVEECRIAKVKNSKLEEYHFETTAIEITNGNIYKGIITSVEPSLQAAFVDFGTERNGFLQQQEIHPDYFQDGHNGNLQIKNLIKRGQEVLVQVTKDPVMKKGAMLSTYISLAGRYLVLMPGSSNRGVSRKISDDAERVRLKEILGKLKIPEGYGVIVRTAGKDCTKTMLSKDLSYLMRLWREINKKAVNEAAPALLHKESNLALRSIRDYFTPDVTEILIDDEAVFYEVKEFVKVISPKHTRIVKQHKAAKPIFTKYQLESQIASIFENRVPLKSGGSIVLDQTEALVAIDVNSGKSTKNESIEMTAFRTNIEAAEEVARQLRLRDMGGLIVIDFIDMKDAKHKAEVEKTLKTFVKDDKARTKVGRISRFGLLEMSRQRIRPSIGYSSFIPCPYCKGKGMTLSTEILSLSFLRKLRLETLKCETGYVRGIVPEDVAGYLLNVKRRELIELELRRECAITIEGDMTMSPGDSLILFDSEFE